MTPRKTVIADHHKSVFVCQVLDDEADVPHAIHEHSEMVHDRQWLHSSVGSQDSG